MRYLILNYKTYPEATGEEAAKLTKIVNKQPEVPNLKVIVCSQTVDLADLKQEFPNVTFWTQHLDKYEAGKHTGSINIASVQEAGASGTLLNHSEKPLPDEEIQETIKLARKSKFTTCICAADLERAQTIALWCPTVIAYEPPELISTATSLIDTNVTAAVEFAELMRPYETPVILGAGVKDADDVRTALKIGYAGVLISSGFVKNSNPSEFLANTLQAFAD